MIKHLAATIGISLFCLTSTYAVQPKTCEYNDGKIVTDVAAICQINIPPTLTPPTSDLVTHWATCAQDINLCNDYLYAQKATTDSSGDPSLSGSNVATTPPPASDSSAGTPSPTESMTQKINNLKLKRQQEAKTSSQKNTTKGWIGFNRRKNSMCKFIRKSPVAIIAATSTLMLLAPTMYAKQDPSSNLDSKAIVAQLKAGQQNQISQNYQPIPSLATTLSAIQNSSSLRALASTQATQNTQNSINDELQSIRKAIIPQENPISDVITLTELTAGLPASDSITLGPNINGDLTATKALTEHVSTAASTTAASLLSPASATQLKQNDMLFNFNDFFAPNTTINNANQLQYSSTYKPNIFIHTLTNPAGFNSSLITGQLLKSLDKFKKILIQLHQTLITPIQSNKPIQPYTVCKRIRLMNNINLRCVNSLPPAL